MNDNFYKDSYKATQHSLENIKIVEIRELYQLCKIRENSETSGSIKIRDCIEPLGDLIEQDYLDYVVFYHDESCNVQKLKSLIDEYKKEAVCVIGCCSNQTENSSLTTEEKNLFDLYCSHFMISELYLNRFIMKKKICSTYTVLILAPKTI